MTIGKAPNSPPLLYTEVSMRMMQHRAEKAEAERDAMANERAHHAQRQLDLQLEVYALQAKIDRIRAALESVNE